MSHDRRSGDLVGVCIVGTTALVVLVVAALVAPGGQRVDVDTVEVSIEHGLETRLGGEVDVRCPADVDLVVGDSFTCDVTADDHSPAQALVTIVNGAGDIAWLVG